MDLVSALQQFGARVFKEPVPGKVHRYRSKMRKDAHIWCRSFGEYARYGDWVTGETVTWRSKEHSHKFNVMNHFQREQYWKAIEKQQQKIDEEERKEKIIFINEEWSTFRPLQKVDDYFIRKDVQVGKDFKQNHEGVTCIPVYGYLYNKSLITYQRIDSRKPKGYQKLFAYNGTSRGGFYPILNNYKLLDCENIFIAEGYATAYSLNKIIKIYSDTMSFCVFSAFSASNMKILAKLFRGNELIANKNIVICADNDQTSFAEAGACNLPYIWFDGPPTYDANDAWLEDKEKAVKQFSESFKRIKY